MAHPLIGKVTTMCHTTNIKGKKRRTYLDLCSNPNSLILECANIIFFEAHKAMANWALSMLATLIRTSIITKVILSDLDPFNACANLITYNSNKVNTYTNLRIDSLSLIIHKLHQ